MFSHITFSKAERPSKYPLVDLFYPVPPLQINTPTIKARKTVPALFWGIRAKECIRPTREYFQEIIMSTSFNSGHRKGVSFGIFF